MDYKYKNKSGVKHMVSIRHSANDKHKIKHIGRKVGNLVAVMLGVSITLVVVLCVLMFY